ncbi:cytochrome c oxidase assembly factor 7-like [Lethenteron reissneri]|uniref:cytochrome c oxidase assembly factor 7-like n=1 Tax=Lethenteron reissneri TaxID=7753 RepID=UPI002AB7DF27|nr:cytochrome c oxidase assembly factor 7-like [Lethenteron reissneri]XP_061436726.1 cytochrome c oxidase assembly factor 7-like [Lethenteron reissneri]
MSVDFTNEVEVREFLSGIRTEYSYQCLREREPEGCHRLAEFLHSVERDFPAAAKLLQLNCEKNGFTKSCAKLGTYHALGRGGVVVDLARAVELFSRSCLGAVTPDPASPASGAASPGSVAASPGSVAASPASTTFTPSPEGCNNLGEMARQGRGFPGGQARPEVARRAFELACAGEVASSCLQLSVMLMQAESRDMPRALVYAERACHLGHPWGCINAGRMLHLGDGVKPDPERARELRERATLLARAAH